MDTATHAGEPSDPYLMTGYDKKTLTLSHKGPAYIEIRAEVDIDGNGNWQPYKTFNVPAAESVRHEFPEAFAAYWIRFLTSKDAVATAQLLYD